MRLEAIAALLGHRSLEMTLVYARIADRVVADEIASACEQIDALYATAATPGALPAEIETKAALRDEVNDDTDVAASAARSNEHFADEPSTHVDDSLDGRWNVVGLDSDQLNLEQSTNRHPVKLPDDVQTACEVILEALRQTIDHGENYLRSY